MARNNYKELTFGNDFIFAKVMRNQTLYIYTFENRCREDLSLSLGDETVKVFLNPKSDIDDIDEDLRKIILK